MPALASLPPPRTVVRIPVAASTAVRPSLAGPARLATVLGRPDGALYLRCPDEWVIAVLAPGAARLPCGLIAGDREAVRELTDAAGRCGVTVGDGVVHAGSVVVVPVRWWDPRPAIRSFPVVVPGAPAVPGLPTAALAAAVESGASVYAPAQRLAGLGPGLTPAGDDVLIGLASALTGRGDPRADELVAAATGRTTDLALALLRHAARGELLGEVAAVLAGGVASWRRLLAVGHSSGAALALGLRMGLAA